MIKQEIKNCPFCGSKAELVRDNRIGLYAVQCTECKCMTTFQFDFGKGKEESKRKAIEVWNRRRRTKLKEERF